MRLLVEKVRSGGADIASVLWLRDTDSRIYDLVRITYAIGAAVNLLLMWDLRHTLFADTGILDGALSKLRTPQPSIFWHVNSEGAVTIVLLVAGIAIVCLGAGLFTRVAALVTYGWHLSYTARIYDMTSGYDEVLRVVGFVLVFCPAAGVWSVDHFLRLRRNPGAYSPNRMIYGLRLLQWQLMLIYLVTVWPKFADSFWRSGEFLSYFMLSIYSKFDSPVVADWVEISVVFTHLTLVCETAIPFLLWNKRTRLLGLAAGLGLHGSILLVSHIEIFSLVMVPLYVAFLDEDDLNRLISTARRLTGRRRAQAHANSN